MSALPRPAAAWALALLLAACGTSPVAPADVPPPDSSLVAVLGTLHLLEARAARYGDVPAPLRAEALARYGFTEASLRREVDRAQQQLPTWEALAIAVDAWMLDPARDGASFTGPDSVEENLGAPSLPPELQ